MATTSPDNAWSPDSVDPYKLTVDLAAMQASVQAALVARVKYFSGSDAARLALAAPYLADGITWKTTDTGITYNREGGVWKPWESKWISYSPSSSSITVGAGTALTRYKYEAGRVRCHFRFKIGAGGNIAGTASVALPVARAALSYPYEMSPEIGHAYDDSATTNYILTVIANAGSTTTVVLGYGTPNISAFLTASVPFTLAAADVYEANFTYDPA